MSTNDDLSDRTTAAARSLEDEIVAAGRSPENEAGYQDTMVQALVLAIEMVPGAE